MGNNIAQTLKNEKAISINEIAKGDTVSLLGKTFVYIGHNDREVFFSNARKGSKYAHYSRLSLDGQFRISDMCRLDVTPDALINAYGF